MYCRSSHDTLFAWQIVEVGRYAVGGVNVVSLTFDTELIGQVTRTVRSPMNSA